MQKRSIAVLAMIWAVVLTAAVSSAVTLSLCGAVRIEIPADDAPRTGGRRFGRLDEILEIMQDQYLTELDTQTLLDGAAKGMMAAAEDPYTFYYTPQEMTEMTEHSQGEYNGIGVLLSADKEGDATILRVFDPSPAKSAGLRAGDRIIEVNGEPVSAASAKELNTAIQAIADAPGNSIELTVLRDDEILTVSTGRDSVTVSRIEHRVLEGNIGYLAIYEFMGDDVTGFRAAQQEFRNAGVRGLILDLRSNPGGLLTDVVDIADALLPEGLIVYTLDRDGRRSEFYSDANAWKVPMAVLVNGMSASASEILAGALQDYGLAEIVGETTYGKGVVQTVIPFRSDGAGLQLTTAAYYTPKGRSIQGVGIEPDHTVIDGKFIHNESEKLEDDPQLFRAWKLLTKGNEAPAR